MIGVGLVGYGYWGPNLARNFHEAEEGELRAICEMQPQRLVGLKRRFPSTVLTTRYEDLLEDPRVDAIVVATPTFNHHSLALAALRAGKHVFVEKPICSTSQEALELVEEAYKRELVLMVDHTFVYTNAVRRIKEIIDEGRLGQLLYYDSVRVNLGLFQKDVNVLWDLAVHDLAIMDFVVPDHNPRAISATGIAHVDNQPVNLAYLTLLFPGNLIGHIQANWLAPAKIRRTILGGDQQMIVYDDLDAMEKIKVYDKGITVQDEAKLRITYRSGDVWCPRVEPGEALQVEAQHFLECIQLKKRPITDGAVGLRIVKMIEAADRSLRSHGEPMELSL